MNDMVSNLIQGLSKKHPNVTIRPTSSILSGADEFLARVSFDVGGKAILVVYLFKDNRPPSSANSYTFDYSLSDPTLLPLIENALSEKYYRFNV